ncbi:MAG: 3,4-dihydroxy-2-butanone-4-phosphate synthase [Cycloclasticus sp.]|jgi:3,4-dihydroxy 2-butanone 4-phosphate synthase/GTP cyclohydrolase II|nr:3,4-dihydroxy-2-butanone-4-phosphate synthase [Cycloclasticus sp.]MDF1690086.1 bifunctional 3,4-dihydroxy-2-butanone-4-phosphate synthase/GTP cyclohydrolase II [Cycloclasticus sp.]MEE4290458.1 bifunctional 3,4-dihydroxy-2-butanone-4-phosphate synthase/GTP cyclohydrolase II [Cycloclasticus sp.]
MNTTQEIIDDLKQGKIVIIMDDEDRENEGDLLMIAEHVRPQDINFMASYGRGLICLTLTRERCQQLRLPLMVNDNQAAYSTNFTVSIEAAEGVTTGISAADRAKTVLAAVKPDAKPTDVVQPGHIFPLMAQPGGVLNRTGHTEAGCDLARLAGFEPAAVIVEILNDDGTMARRDDLRMFAEKHELKIGTIADLIHYRIQNEKTIELVSSCDYPTKYGDFRLHAFQDEIDNKLHLALTYGDVSTDEPVMVRINAKSTLADLLQAKENDHYPLPSAMQKIADEGRGALILIRNKEDNQSIVEFIHEQELKEKGVSKLAPQPMVDSREVGVGCQILTELGIKNLKLLGTPTKYSGLAGFDIEIVEHVPLD